MHEAVKSANSMRFWLWLRVKGLGFRVQGPHNEDLVRVMGWLCVLKISSIGDPGFLLFMCLLGPVSPKAPKTNASSPSPKRPKPKT